MNILIAGSGKGSWDIRGVQLGAALGARVTTMPSDDDWCWADVAVLVKRHAVAFAPMAHRFGVPIVWDALDFWSQPRDNGVTPEHARRLLMAQIDLIKPALTIGATQAMADACDGVYLPHHSWAGLMPTPPRETVKTVAYQGSPLYLGRWKDALEKECARRGWTFVINPGNLSDADILVALRDGQWDGWICREWKSGVKLINAMAAGRPIISQQSAAMREIGPDGAVADSFNESCLAFDRWSDYEWRHDAYECALEVAPAYTVDRIAARYLDVLASVQVAA